MCTFFAYQGEMALCPRAFGVKCTTTDCRPTDVRCLLVYCLVKTAATPTLFILKLFYKLWLIPIHVECNYVATVEIMLISRKYCIDPIINLIKKKFYQDIESVSFPILCRNCHTAPCNWFLVTFHQIYPIKNNEQVSQCVQLI